jgi:hypothetical protein
VILCDTNAWRDVAARMSQVNSSSRHVVRLGGGKVFVWGLIAQSALAAYRDASREGFTPRQPALTGNGGE